MRWWRRQRKTKPDSVEASRASRLPDGDRVLKDGQRRSVDLLPDWAREPTHLLPIVTPAARSRGQGRRQ
jgi:hypothetical protein